MVQCCCDRRVTDLQLPIQTTSSRLLKLMNRKYTASSVVAFVEQVHHTNDTLFLRTDLIVGFPTETQEELEESLMFVIRYFDEVAVYGFELKKGTPIAATSLDMWDSETIAKRVQEATSRLDKAGLLVHSGGQEVLSLSLSDQKKEQMRYIRRAKYGNEK